jgi:hypothetical protein
MFLAQLLPAQQVLAQQVLAELVLLQERQFSALELKLYRRFPRH